MAPVPVPPEFASIFIIALSSVDCTAINEFPVCVASTSPAKVELLPLTVIGASVKVFDVPEPDHKATFCPVPAPSNTEELSIFSHSSVPPCSINTAQSPVTQSVTPSKFVLPDVDTI